MAKAQKREIVRYRTPAASLSGNGARRGGSRLSASTPVTSPGLHISEERMDARIQRTRSLLHKALSGLIREKSYDRITVAKILNRAGVSRSTFYIHFRDKDELLKSSIHALLLGALSAHAGTCADVAERMVAFSLPLFTHVHQHRLSSKTRLGDRGRGILHEHLHRVISEWIARAAEELRFQQLWGSPVAPELLAQHIASTFVLVLHWWMDTNASRSPAEADTLFRSLVMPVLRST